MINLSSMRFPTASSPLPTCITCGSIRADFTYLQQANEIPVCSITFFKKVPGPPNPCNKYSAVNYCAPNWEWWQRFQAFSASPKLQRCSPLQDAALPVLVNKTLLLHKPLPCNPAAEIVPQPLIIYIYIYIYIHMCVYCVYIYIYIYIYVLVLRKLVFPHVLFSGAVFFTDTGSTASAQDS